MKTNPRVFKSLLNSLKHKMSKIQQIQPTIKKIANHFLIILQIETTLILYLIKSAF